MASARGLLQALTQRVLVMDGATGTGLMGLRPDVDPRRGLERLVVDDPDTVRALHAGHVRAGCAMVRTNTFCGSAPELAAVGLADQARALARRAAELAREAIDAAGASGAPPFVLGVIGPGSVPPVRVKTTVEDLIEAERERVEGLTDGGVDAFLVETARDPVGVQAAVATIRAVAPNRPILVSFTVEATGRLATGAGMVEIAELARGLDLDLVALNCSNGPRSLDGPLDALRQAWNGPLGAWPNAGVPAQLAGPPRWPIDPEMLAHWAAGAVARLDLRLVGGCCGTTADHVAAIARRLRAQSDGDPR